jgi:hypothetical protein
VVAGLINLGLVTVGVIAALAGAMTGVSVALQRRYRGKRGVTDAQWESWAVDTVEWSIDDPNEFDEVVVEEAVADVVDETQNNPTSEGLPGVRRSDQVEAPDDLEAGEGPHHQEEDEPARAAGDPQPAAQRV